MFTARPIRLLLLALAATLPPAAGPATLLAQDAAGQADARTRLGSARLLLLETADGEVVRGQPVGWVDDWILLDDGRRIAFGQILRAEALRARTGEGARWGALVGLAAGAGLFVASSSEGLGSAAEGVAFVSGGALVGGALGALWGSRQYRSELIYSAPTANARAPQTGLIESRLGSGPGEVRTTLAVTPFVGVGSYGYRTGTSDGGYEVGLASSRELGVQVQYAMGPRSAVRVAGAALHTSAQETSAGHRNILHQGLWLARAEVGLELRMRANVPGYIVIAADAFYNPHGYVTTIDPATSQVVQDDIDAGVMPRIGAGLGFDFFTPGDRRIRIEWIYRIGRYNQPDVEARGLETTRITRDSSFTLGVYLPLVRPND